MAQAMRQLASRVDDDIMADMLRVRSSNTRSKQNNFSNAHVARKLIHQAINFQEERIANKSDLSDEELTLITYEDVEKIPFFEL